MWFLQACASSAIRKQCMQITRVCKETSYGSRAFLVLTSLAKCWALEEAAGYRHCWAWG